MTSEEQFLDITRHLCNDYKPSIYLNELMDSGALDSYPFSMLADMKKTPQSPIHHPEGNVWIHVCMVVDEAASLRERSDDPRIFMWAALLHDIGKPLTTKIKGSKITSYEHDKVGMRQAKKFLLSIIKDRVFINKVCKLVRYHMQPMYVVKNMPFAELSNMKRDVDVREVALLGYCDRMGRGGNDRDSESESAYMKEFLRKCGKAGKRIPS